MLGLQSSLSMHPGKTSVLQLSYDMSLRLVGSDDMMERKQSANAE